MISQTFAASNPFASFVAERAGRAAAAPQADPAGEYLGQLIGQARELFGAHDVGELAAAAGLPADADAGTVYAAAYGRLSSITRMLVAVIEGEAGE